MELNNYIKTEGKFFCEICDFKCCIKSDMNRHILTRKHKLNKNGIKKELNYIVLHSLEKSYNCNCGKNYNTQSGLWKHKKKCNNNDKSDDKELIMTLVKQNKELIEIIKNNNTVNNNTVNNNNTFANNTINNKTFNLQVFLNETCKDAINLSEFIDNISLQLSDLENVGKLGYVEGVSNIIIKNLRALDVEKRPVHCSDLKREKIIVKENDEWIKDGEKKVKIKGLINNILHQNLQLLLEYEKKYPDCNNPLSKRSDEYNKLVMEVVGGNGDETEKGNEKIIRKIAKEVVIDK